jgi:hypothetical protein
MVFQHSGARDFDLGGGFQHSTTSFPNGQAKGHSLQLYGIASGLGYSCVLVMNPRDPFFLAIRRVPKLHAGNASKLAGNGLTCDEGESASAR